MSDQCHTNKIVFLFRSAVKRVFFFHQIKNFKNITHHNIHILKSNLQLLHFHLQLCHIKILLFNYKVGRSSYSHSDNINGS